MEIPFILPNIPYSGSRPIWCGDKFKIDSEFTQILNYSTNTKGWNDTLTTFHEESAGSNHFIDCASRSHCINQLQNHILKENSVILEIGCSSGFMLQQIQKEFPKAVVIGADIIQEPLEKLAKTIPGVPLFRFDLLQCPLPDNCVDAIVMLNVLEHIEYDGIAMQQIYRVLKPGGIAILEVPAGSNLYDIYDKLMMHYRRYNMGHLTDLVKKQGFNIVKKSHLGFFLYPGFWLVKTRNKKLLLNSEDSEKKLVREQIKNTSKNSLMHILMQTELFIGRYFNYPIGIRCIITCQKNQL